MTSMHFPTIFIFVNDGRHVTLSGAKSPKVWVTLAMLGTDLEDFDLFPPPVGPPTVGKAAHPPSGKRGSRCGFLLRGV